MLRRVRNNFPNVDCYEKQIIFTPLFEKEGLGEIYQNKIPLDPPFSKGEVIFPFFKGGSFF
jgi:hypothetical protein